MVQCTQARKLLQSSRHKTVYIVTVPLNYHVPRMNVLLYFICFGSVELRGTQGSKTIQNDHYKVFGRVLHVENQHRTSASFCFLSNVVLSVG